MSTGELVMSREGLKADESPAGFDSNADQNSSDSLFYFRQLMKGPISSGFDVGFFNFDGSNTEQFTQWWSASGIQIELFDNNQADFLRLGEQIHVIAINRPTGYIASQLATVQQSDAGGNSLDVTIPKLQLYPPNLQIKAERTTQTELGLTQGEINQYLIGSEGSGLTSDNYISISTLWQDQDGRPLPEDLPGYSAMVAKITGNTQLGSDAGCTSNVDVIDIKPGNHRQLLKLKNGCDLNNDHYYFYTCGHQSIDPERDKCFSFGEPGRPNYYVPVKVPLYNDIATRRQNNLLRYAAQDGTDTSSLVTDPIYQWVYRPEMQFSVFELDQQQIRLEYEQDGVVQSLNLADADLDELSEIFSDNTSYVDIYYSLLGPEYNALQPFASDRELILALGEYEVSINANSTDPVRLDQLTNIIYDPADLLTLQIYQNSDDENTLWEYAFWQLNINVVDDNILEGDDIVYVNADDTTIELTASLDGYNGLDDETKAKAPNVIYWKIEAGNGSLFSKTTALDESGAATTQIYINPSVDNIVSVKAYLEDNANVANPLATAINIGVVPGKPNSINLTSSGAAYIKGNGEVTVSALIRDRNNNLVTDGTGVLFRERGHINITETTGLSSDGVVTAKLKGGSVSGSYNLEVTSGEAIASNSITVASLNVAINGIPASLQADTDYILTAKVTGGNTQEHENIFIDLGVNAGMITQRDLVTNAQGEIQFTYRTPKTSGNYQIAAKLDLNNPQVTNINVASAASTSAVLTEREYMVAGVTSATGSVNNYLGQQATLQYPIETQITLQGTAGENWTLTENSPHFPNHEPLYFSRFSNIYKDQLQQYPSTASNIARNNTPYAGIKALQQLNSDANWSINATDDFKVASPSYNFWVNLNNSGEIFTVDNGNIRLSYTGGNLTGEVNRTSITINSIPQNQWLAVALRVKDGALTLTVDDQQASAPFIGSINYSGGVLGSGNEWLSLNSGFTGQIAGLRIYDLDRDALVELAPTSGTFDTQGEASVILAMTTAAQQQDMAQPSVTVGLLDHNNTLSTINILSKSSLDQMATAVHNVTTGSSLTSDNVIQKMPLNTYFPDPKNGGAQLASSYALQSNAQSATNNTLANLNWFAFQSQYPSLQNDVQTLQSYFARAEHSDIAYYASEYLQEAVVQASYDNPFWFRTLATSFKVWSEMIQSNPSQADQIAQAIKNRRDFTAWLRVLSIPANGWATDSIPIPRPDMTCDKVSNDINVGTPLAYSITPCRARGDEIASLVIALNEIDPETLNNPELLTIYMTHIMAAIKQMPLEYKKWFYNGPAIASHSFSLFPEAHAAIPAVISIPFRIMAVLIKQSLRKASGGAPSNFIALLQGGTTSRVSAQEILPAIAYLASRADDSPLCQTDCQALLPQVSETVLQDIAVWMIGMGLSDNGKIPEEDARKQQQCTLTNNVHGKAFELVGTAMYHALYEFGGDIGVDNSEQYEILLSDPRKGQNIIKVALMQKNKLGEREIYQEAFQRKPDLILAGDGDRRRQWIEFKSWSYNKKNFDGKKLKTSAYGNWTARKTKKLSFTKSAQRQHFLDHVASLDILTDDYWAKPDQQLIRQFKPTTHKTWIQVWKAEKEDREWRRYKKVAGTRQFSKETIKQPVAEPWISAGSQKVIGNIPANFQALQRFLSSVSVRAMDKNMFESSVGYPISEHEKEYIKDQVSSNFTELGKSNIAPFTINTFLALEIGTSQLKEARRKLLEAIGPGDFADLQEKIADGSITEADIAELRNNIDDQIEALLGPFSLLLIDIPGLSYVEDKIADQILGSEVEELRETLANIKLPDNLGLLDNICEDL